MTQREKTIALYNLRLATRNLHRAFNAAPDPRLIRVMTALAEELGRIEDEPVEPDEQHHSVPGRRRPHFTR